MTSVVPSVGGFVEAPMIAWSVDELSVLVNGLRSARPFVVVDREALHASGLAGAVEASLDGLPCAWWDRFQPNPLACDAADAARAAAAHHADVVIAIGGGSCLDTAKIAALAASDPDRVEALSQGESVENARPLPVIAAPTTSGTGSEATHFAAIYVGDRRDPRKISVAHQGLRPAAVVLDIRAQLAMPVELAAHSGLDALCQAMESMWAVQGDGVSRAFAMRAGAKIASALLKSVRDGTTEARHAMMVGAHDAGCAIDVSKTTASHAMSYRLTSRYGLAHGHAVALTVGHVAAWNAGITGIGADAVRERVRAACGFIAATPETAAERVRELLDELGLPSTLSAAGVDADAIGELAESVDPVRLGNNPRPLHFDDLKALLERAM